MSKGGKTVLLLFLLLLIAGGYLLYFGPNKCSEEIAWQFLHAKDATLSISSAQKVQKGGELTVEINFKTPPNTKVAAMEFVFNYDNGIFYDPAVKKSPLLEKCKKQAMYKISENKGIVKAVIFSVNREIIKNGKLMEITLKVNSDLQPGKTSLSINGIVAADPEAKAVNVVTKAKEIDII